MPSYDPDPFSYLRDRATRRGGKYVAPTGPLAIIYVEIGNSHGGGRPSALGTELWASTAYQWTQAGALQQMLGTGRYNLDQVAGGSYSTSTVIAPAGWDNTNPPGPTYAQIGPALWHSQLIAADFPDARIVYVAHNKNATGFIDGSWTAAGAPSNLLGQAVARANAARLALIALGYVVVWGGVTFHNADPDYDESTNWATHRSNIDGMIDYLRANLAAAPGSMPILIGSGMTNAQLSSLSVNDRNYQADLAQARRRRPYVWTIDNINPLPGMTVTGLPLVPMVDGIHENYAGVQVLGQLRYLGYPKAAANALPRTPFHNLSFASSIVGLYDFRSAARTDFSGRGNTLSNVTAGGQTAFPLNSFEPLIGGYIYRRTRSTSTGRQYQVPQALTASYTKMWYGKFEDFTATQGLFEDGTTALGTARHQLRYSLNSDAIYAGHGATNSGNSVQSATGIAASLGTTNYHHFAVTYDAATTTMKLYIDGSLVATNAACAAATFTTGGFIGASDAVDPPGNPMAAWLPIVINMNRAATLVEVQEARAASLLLLV